MNEAPSAIIGCVLGTAVGDALGLPYEGVSRTRLARMLGPPDRHRFLFGRGMVSDDTEHTCMVVQSLIAADFNVDKFTIEFARRLRWWFILLPAGIGMATARSCFKLWLGFSPKSSGVFSAGNGPAMRSAIFGAAIDDVERMLEFVRASALITHSDPKAEVGAIAVALAAFVGRRQPMVDGQRYVDQLATITGSDGEEFVLLMRGVVESVSSAESTLEFANKIGQGRGVTGYTYHTVPVVIHAWLSNPRDYRAAIMSVIECGGDTDTTAAIVGGIVGTATGEEGIPKEWVSNICEWPRSINWMRRLCGQLVESISGSVRSKPFSLNLVAVLMRNIVFLVVVLFHGFRRLLPPF